MANHRLHGGSSYCQADSKSPRPIGPSSPASVSLDVIRVQDRWILSPGQLDMAYCTHFSRMKYGDPVGTRHISDSLLSSLLNNRAVKRKLRDADTLFIASSAYGSVPTAAKAVADHVAAGLELSGFLAIPLKIERDGDFARADFSQLGPHDRKMVLQQRSVHLVPEAAMALGASTSKTCLIVIDDVRASGAHEAALEALLRAHMSEGQLVFAYPVRFGATLCSDFPHFESLLNDTAVRTLSDLLPFYEQSAPDPLVNTRTLKFILAHGNDPCTNLGYFLDRIGPKRRDLLRRAATGQDSYADIKPYSTGVSRLIAHCERPSRRPIFDAAKSVSSCWTVSTNGRAITTRPEAGTDCSAQCETLLKAYSRFKYGSVNDISFLSDVLARRLIARTQAPDSVLMRLFQRAKSQSEIIYFTAPGVRNVTSSSNWLLREAGIRYNAWLGRQGLPTGVIRPLTRLGSGRADYAQLTSQQRRAREKSTQSLIPESDLRRYPVHVIFIDDMIASGATVERAARKFLKAGARSFSAEVLFMADVSPTVDTRADPKIEHALNTYCIGPELNADVAKILQDQRYQPVQRMLRLLLCSDNRPSLASFLTTHPIPGSVLERLYHHALANDYFSTSDQNGVKTYAPSLKLIEGFLP